MYNFKNLCEGMNQFIDKIFDSETDESKKIVMVLSLMNIFVLMAKSKFKVSDDEFAACSFAFIDSLKQKGGFEGFSKN